MTTSANQRIAAIREAIAKVEQERCTCKLCWLCLDNEIDCEECGGRGVSSRCARCEHIEDLEAQLQEAEGAR